MAMACCFPFTAAAPGSVKKFAVNSFAKTTTISCSALSGACVVTALYSMVPPTAKAVFEGKVQGVVVQAIKYTGFPEKLSNAEGKLLFAANLNMATAVLSFTSL